MLLDVASVRPGEICCGFRLTYKCDGRQRGGKERYRCATDTFAVANGSSTDFTTEDTEVHRGLRNRQICPLLSPLSSVNLCGELQFCFFQRVACPNRSGGDSLGHPLEARLNDE